MSTALDSRKAIQTTLGFTGDDVDGEIGPKTKAALASLEAADDASPWPPRVVQASSLPPQAGMPAPQFSASFLAFVPSFIFEWEGTTFENDPDDDGNKGDGITPGNYGTKFGIDAASHPGIDIVHLNPETATAVHWRDWLKTGCGALASPFAEVFYNCAMNMGLGEARRFAANHTDAGAFLDAQEAHYRGIADAHPVDEKYLRGWLNRTEALRKRFNLGIS